MAILKFTWAADFDIHLLAVAKKKIQIFLACQLSDFVLGLLGPYRTLF